MPKIQTWSPKETKKILSQRLVDAKDDRRQLEYRWQENERIVFNTQGENTHSNINYSFDSDITSLAGVDQGDENLGINYTFKNYRLIHAQLSGNPPSVVPRPTSNDPDDRRKADAADRLVRFALREYQLQETVDEASNYTLLYGTGVTKTIWNSDEGDILDLDEDSGELTMEGEFEIKVPNIWNIFLDPDAQTLKEMRYVFERITIPWDEAKFKWPEKIDILRKFRRQSKDYAETSGHVGSVLKAPKYDVVELYEYWEKGMPLNGYLGRYCICSEEGDLITDMLGNPERYAPPPKKNDKRKRVPIAILPYQFFTEIDVPGRIWGKSFVEYNTNIQDMLNRIDSVTLENMQAHGVARIILPEGAEISDESITNSPWDIIKMTGTQPPHFMEPMPLPQIIPTLMDRYKLGIDDMSGVNESMFGQQSREQSGFSMQYATNQGNMIRRRLFNKYVLFVEEIYKAFLRIVRKHWDIPRTIEVLGKEKAFEAMDIKGADIDGGFDLVVEYGASLSLDPTTRREEILTLMPLFEKAGVEPRKMMEMLKLNELSGMYDTLELAKDRQRELFEEMITSGLYLPPEDLQDHKNMLTFAYYYLMTTEFKYLEDNDKALIRRHVKEREALAVDQIAGAGMDTGAAPGPAPAGAPAGAPPALAGNPTTPPPAPGGTTQG